LEEIKNGNEEKQTIKKKTIQSNEAYGLYYSMLSSQLKLGDSKTVVSAFNDKEEDVELNFYK